ncbi:MAG: DegT/DnrJ/EryC1/StrS aminotransferase [uncultured bacterium]|nr:MAG: DegT/DnrJ/EryC1/StrS aminotransferase [uncultured bacterium]
MIRAYPRHSSHLPKNWINFFLKCFLNRKLIHGNQIDTFNKSFSDFIGAPHSFSFIKARTAFIVLLNCLKLKPDDEILVSKLNFKPLIDIIKLYQLKPVFVDIGTDSMIAPKHIEPLITAKTKALLLTHLYGDMCKIKDIIHICEKNNLIAIEDAAQSFGANIDGKYAGTFGKAGIFSLGQGKTLNCFGGGVIVTNDNNLAHDIKISIQQLKSITPFYLFKIILKSIFLSLTTAKPIFSFLTFPIIKLMELLSENKIDYLLDERYHNFCEHAVQKTSYIISNFQATIGINNLYSINKELSRTIENSDFLTKQLMKIKYSILLEHNDLVSTILRSYFPIKVKNRSKIRRQLLSKGIDTQIPDLYYYSNSEDYPCEFINELLEIPFSKNYSKNELVYIADTIIKTLNENEIFNK